MSEVKVNKISPRTNCGTVQLGDSGDTITIPAGATITNNGTAAGFGATGAASWDTTVKTASFTGVAGVGYFVNTTSGAITVTLPASPDAGAVIAVKDYANTFDTNNVTLARNGSNIGGQAIDATLSTEGLAVTLVYVDATQGWLVTDDGLQSQAPTELFVTATGGTVTCCGNYKIHTFTGPGTFTVTCGGNAQGSNTVDYLVVAGGGGGAGDAGGAGGAGGFRLSNSTCMPAPLTSPLATPTALPVTAQGYPITVGAGGSGATSGSPAPAGCAGSNSVFSTITSAAGGGGASSGGSAAGPGGSGGGGRGGNPIGGTGNTPPVSPPQGQPGGNGPAGGGGGGGAVCAGTPAGPSSPTPGGAGGTGSFAVSSGFAGCNGTTGPVCGARYFAGGGGGGGDQCGTSGGTGGTGGGGAGAGRPAPSPATAGTTNTGGGGGGGGVPFASSQGGSGGSGIVIIRYKFQ